MDLHQSRAASDHSSILVLSLLIDQMIRLPIRIGGMREATIKIQETWFPAGPHNNYCQNDPFVASRDSEEKIPME